MVVHDSVCFTEKSGNKFFLVAIDQPGKEPPVSRDHIFFMTDLQYSSVWKGNMDNIIPFGPFMLFEKVFDLFDLDDVSANKHLNSSFAVTMLPAPARHLPG